MYLIRGHVTLLTKVRSVIMWLVAYTLCVKGLRVKISGLTLRVRFRTKAEFISIRAMVALFFLQGSINHLNTGRSLKQQRAIVISPWVISWMFLFVGIADESCKMVSVPVCAILKNKCLLNTITATDYDTYSCNSSRLDLSTQSELNNVTCYVRVM